MFSDEQVTKFQSLYKTHFGKSISREEAYDQGLKLLRLIEIIYKPMTETDYQLLQKRRQETSKTLTK